MTEFEDVWYPGHDGLQLYARDYRANGDAPTLLCMHGLSRNSADFEDLCDVLGGDYRIIAVDQRGRGRSAYDANPENYNPAVYVQDMFALLKHLNASSVIAVGTSMGGIMAMMMTVMQPQMIRALVINDIGPEVAADGLARIQSYVGKSKPVSDWTQAVAQTKAINGVAFPALNDQEWLKFAKRLYQEDAQGRPVLAYDPAIAEPIQQSQGRSLSLDLWPTFEAIVTTPLLLIRGELSDILAPDCVARMQALKPDLRYVQVPDVGHAPLLSEAAAVNSIRKFLGAL